MIHPTKQETSQKKVSKIQNLPKKAESGKHVAALATQQVSIFPPPLLTSSHW